MAQENNGLDLPADEAGDLQKKADEYLNNWKRAAADLINYKKEEMARAGMLIGYAKESMFENILPIIDSIYLMEKQTNKLEFIGLSEGVEMIKKQIQDFLKKEGIEEINAIGNLFDANSMEALGEISNDQFPIPNTVVEEVQKGYKMGEKVLRPAKVKVTK